mmetsp:Transcript_60005/g.190618  ORF Transcript_60005/g.190618 Transcript_60005/m.190618 type:complete len:200 (+) Transcript_60005:1476-2075(+)
MAAGDCGRLENAAEGPARPRSSFSPAARPPLTLLRLSTCERSQRRVAFSPATTFMSASSAWMMAAAVCTRACVWLTSPCRRRGALLPRCTPRSPRPTNSEMPVPRMSSEPNQRTVLPWLLGAVARARTCATVSSWKPSMASISPPGTSKPRQGPPSQNRAGSWQSHAHKSSSASAAETTSMRGRPGPCWGRRPSTHSPP